MRSTAGGGDADVARSFGWLDRAECVHPPVLPQLRDHTVAASAQVRAGNTPKVVRLHIFGYRPVPQPVYQGQR